MDILYPILTGKTIALNIKVSHKYMLMSSKYNIWG